MACVINQTQVKVYLSWREKSKLKRSQNVVWEFADFICMRKKL